MAFEHEAFPLSPELVKSSPIGLMVLNDFHRLVRAEQDTIGLDDEARKFAAAIGVDLDKIRAESRHIRPSAKIIPFPR